MLLENGFGRTWNGPLDTPREVLDQVTRATMSRHWELGRTKPAIVIWLVAPNVGSALRAAQPLIERGLEIRCVSMDVREVVPGREWSIGMAEPADQARNSVLADAFGDLLIQIADRHLEESPAAASRLYLGLEPASISWVDDIGWAELGWRAAGGASVFYGVRNDRIECELHNHSWTDGQAWKMREPLLRLCRELRKQHPRVWPWSADDPAHAANQRFVEGAVRLVNAFCQGLQEIGAFDVEPWGYWMPSDAPAGQ